MRRSTICSARLETSFDAQRRFVANASHELRTPLTVERTLLQVALADPNASAETLRATCEELLVTGRDQERLIEALLTLASSERGLEVRERADIGALATPMVEQPRPELDQRQINLETHLEAAITEGDAALIEPVISTWSTTPCATTSTAATGRSARASRATARCSSSTTPGR